MLSFMAEPLENVLDSSMTADPRENVVVSLYRKSRLKTILFVL